MFYPLHNCRGYLFNSDCLICTKLGSPYAVRWVVPVLSLCVPSAARLHRGYLCLVRSAPLASWAICAALCVSSADALGLASAPLSVLVLIVSVTSSHHMSRSYWFPLHYCTTINANQCHESPHCTRFDARISISAPHCTKSSALCGCGNSDTLSAFCKTL